MRWLLLVSLLVSGCMSQNQKESSNVVGMDASGGEGKTDSREYVGKDAQVNVQTLRFVSADEQKRFTAARKCFTSRGASWEHYPLRKIGNFVSEDWCRGEGAHRGCSGGGFTERAGVEWAEISTLHYPQGWPEVFGVLVSAGRNRAKGEAGWNVTFSVNSNGKSIVGENTHIDFRRGDDHVHLGSGYEWTIAERRFSQSIKENPWVIFERLRSSPDVLRDEGMRQWRALEKEVVAALENNEVRKCVYGPYKGGGIPPACVDMAVLDSDEKAKELNKIRSTAGRIVELLEKENVAMYSALLEIASPECF